MNIIESVQNKRPYRNTVLSLIAALFFVFAFTQTLQTQQGSDPEDTTTKPAAGGNTLVYLPVLTRSVLTPTLNPIGRPNAANQWLVSWQSDNPESTAYELQESFDANFATILNTYNVAAGTTSKQIAHTPGIKNVYHYRVRAVANGAISDWSNAHSVIVGYRDDFNDPSSGWAIRRTTFIEEIHAWYEDGKFVLQVHDKWDWGLASPLVQAPDVPYAIEYQSQPAHIGNLISHGAVFGGDWTGEICPDYSTPQGVYDHDFCFNHFYNANTIWYGPLKLTFERVDYLIWCPTCEGSPMKRLTNNPGSWFEIDPIPNVDSEGTNTWRIEVRDTGLTFFANGSQYAHTGDTTWINDPYFGVFGSTDEYNNSTWRYEYYQVMPLDN